MIRLYDLGREERYKRPCLLTVKKFDVEINIQNKTELVHFINHSLNLSRYDVEHIYLITTDLYNNVLAVFLIGIGDYKGCKLYNRNIATAILLSGGRKFIIAHNHPDGALVFSEDDVMVVGLMTAVGKLLETEFVNSYVITSKGFITNDMETPIYYDKKEI